METALEFDISIRKSLRSGNREFQLDATFDSASKRLVIFGPSGSGKSLTLKAIAGLLTPDSGHIRLGNTVLFDKQAGINLPPQERHIGYMFQDYALFPHLNVRQNIGFALAKGWFNPGSKHAVAAVEHWIDAFQLGQVAHQLPDQLSGGQRQRTALARALVNAPRALLLDEPFAALDPELREQMRNELDQLQRKLEIPMIVISHDQADAHLLAQHIVCLRDGKIERNEA